MRDSLPAFQRHLQSQSRSPRTVKTYEGILFSFCNSSSANPPTRNDVEGFLARPRADGVRRSAATHNQELAALRAFVKFAKRDLGWTEDPTADVPFAREAPRDPAVLSVFELRRLFTLAAKEELPWRRARDLALLALLSQIGLRVHELVALDVAQVDLASATLVAVLGKGGTMHDLPLNAPTLSLLIAWFAERAKLRAAGDEPALFVSTTGRLAVRGVQRLLERLRAAMGTAKHITPHTLRHTTATLALTMGSDLSTVGDLLRHADLNVTRRYLHLVDERRREAVRRLGVAIPPELVTGAAPGAPTGVAPTFDGRTENVRPLHERLDVQHGLDDAAGPLAA